MTDVVRMPVLRVWIDGREVTQRFSARVRYGLDLRVAEAEISVPVVPAWAVVYNPTTGRGSLVTIVMGPTPQQAYGRFAGFYVGCTRTLWPRGATLSCRGLLERARSYQQATEDGIDMAAGGAGATDQVQVGSVLDTVGLSAVNLGTMGGLRGIAGTGKNLGTASPDFTWREGESGLSYIERLDAVCLGYRTFETFGGSIVRVLISTIPTITPASTFTEGVDIFSGDEGEDSLERRNRIVVTGYGLTPMTAAYAVTAEAGAGSYITEQITSAMIEKDLVGDAGDGIAAQEVSDWQYGQFNRTIVRLTFTTPRGDMIGPAQTIKVQGAGGIVDRLGLAQNMWTQHVEVEVSERGEFTQTVQCLAGLSTVSGGGGGGGGTGGGDIPGPDLPPMVGFDMISERESVVSGSSEVPLYVVHCKPTALPLSGTITSYAWTAIGGTPASGTGETFTTSYPDPVGKSITLQVTDSGALTATATKTIPTAASVLWTRRPLFDAGEAQMESFDGAIWRVATGASDTLVASNGPVWGSIDRVYYSSDHLLTAPGYSIPAAGVNVTALWVETDISGGKVLAGLADGSVYLSKDAGATWTSLGSPEASPILRVIINRYATGQYFALTAGGYYDTVDGGVSWANRNPAPAGATWFDVAHSWDRSYLVAGDDGAGNPYAEDSTGAAQTFPAGAAGLYAVTARINGGYACYDSAKNTCLSASGSGTFTATTTLPVGVVAQPRGLWRDGAVADLFYIAAGTGGIWKSVDGFGSSGGYFQIRAPGVGNSPADADYTEIGADGLLYATPTPIDPFVVDGRIMHFSSLTPSGYEFRDGGLPGGYNATGLTSDCADRRIMYAVVNGTLYKSGDAGVSWASLSWPASPDNVKNVYANTSIPGEVWASVWGNNNDYSSVRGHYKSTDYGVTWTQKHQQSYSGFWISGSNVTANGQNVWVSYLSFSNHGGTTYGSVDGGSTFTEQSYRSYISMANSMARQNPAKGASWWAHGVRAYGWNGPDITTDGGATWVDRDSTLTEGSNYEVLGDVLYSPDGSFLLATIKNGSNPSSTWKHGLRRSTDDGATWTQVIDDINAVAENGGAAFDIAIAADNLTCFVGGSAGWLYYSCDGGLTWTSFQTDRLATVSVVHVAEEYV